MKKNSIIAILIIAAVSFSSCRTTNNYYSTSKTAIPAFRPSSYDGRCAVLNFQAGTDVSDEEIETISYNFRTNFHPSKYAVVESVRVNKAIADLGYDKANMTKEQLCDLGRKLETNLIVVGTINKLMEEYSVDVQVINVSKGTTAASEGNAFAKSDYRNAVKGIAQRLANKLQ